jgi:hypothetical protein
MDSRSARETLPTFTRSTSLSRSCPLNKAAQADRGVRSLTVTDDLRPDDAMPGEKARTPSYAPSRRTPPMMSAASGGRPLAPGTVKRIHGILRRALNQGVEKEGVPDVRLHDLRHFVATQLLSAGVDVRTVAGRLGHRSAQRGFNVAARSEQSTGRTHRDRRARATHRPSVAYRFLPVGCRMKPFIRFLLPERLASEWQQSRKPGEPLRRVALTWCFTWQPVRDSNPCRHLERVVS